VKPPRGLSAEEADAWAKVATTVKRYHAPRSGEGSPPPAGGPGSSARAVADPGSAPPAPLRRPPPAPRPPLPRSAERTPPSPAPGLDSHWDRRFRAGAIEPDFTLDLHGHTLDQAHDRLDAGLAQAKTMGARVVLVIAGKPRPVDAADRGSKRGAIRAKLLDWLAAGPHGSSVAAVRAAHRKHGGEGALYLVLKRRG
jgi:DNA-nicking Smr family endonuclease